MTLGRFDELATGVYLAVNAAQRCWVVRITRMGHGVTIIDTAVNGEELESDAITALYAQGGSLQQSGWYTCPSALAERAVYQKQHYRPWAQHYGLPRQRRRGWTA